VKPLRQWRNRAQYFEAGGHRIAYWTSRKPAEETPWLLLIHGYPTSSWDWSAVWPALDVRFNLVAFDMLGFGLSDKPKNIAYAIGHQADLGEALLARLGVAEAHLFAHDYGNTVAQELLARDNEGGLSFAVKSVCFLNGGLFPEHHRARPIQKLGLSAFGFVLGLFASRDMLSKGFDQLFGPATKASGQEIDAHWALIREQNGEKILHKLLHYIPERKANRPRWVGALQNARAPLRLIDGGADPVSGKHLYDYYLETVPNADAVLLEDIGHYPHTEAPERVAKAFLAFHKMIGTTKG